MTAARARKPGRRRVEWEAAQRAKHKDKSGMKRGTTPAEIVCTVIVCFCPLKIEPFKEWIGDSTEIRTPELSQQTTEEALFLCYYKEEVNVRCFLKF